MRPLRFIQTDDKRTLGQPERAPVVIHCVCAKLAGNDARKGVGRKTQ
jgi:hypothetical protein